MLNAPPDFDERALVRLLECEFGTTGSVEFQPVGEDSWAYRAGSLWVSLRRDLRGHVPAAYEAACQLRARGLDFVLAPLRAPSGRVVHTVDGRPVLVFPYVEVEPVTAGDPSRAEAQSAVAMLERVHRSAVDPAIPSEDFSLPFAADVELALDLAASGLRDVGPLSAPLHRLLRLHRRALEDLYYEFRDLARSCAAAPGEFVLTHGEPIASNFLRRGAELLLADWGDAMWGPPERDWSHVERTLFVAPSCRPSFRRLYDIRWILSEVAEYASVLAEPHAGDDDDRAMWDRLTRYLPAVQSLGDEASLRGAERG